MMFHENVTDKNRLEAAKTKVDVDNVSDFDVAQIGYL